MCQGLLHFYPYRPVGRFFCFIDTSTSACYNIAIVSGLWRLGKDAALQRLKDGAGTEGD